MQHNISVLPRRTAKYYDSELRVMAKRVYGYQFRCSCGEKGRTWDKYYDAHNEGMGHKFHANAPDPLTAA